MAAIKLRSPYYRSPGQKHTFLTDDISGFAKRIYERMKLYLYNIRFNYFGIHVVDAGNTWSDDLLVKFSIWVVAGVSSDN